MIFATQRLFFEEWSLEDLPLLYALHADQTVQAGYSLGPEAWTWEGIEKRLNLYIKEQDMHGHTKWKVSLRDGTFVGRAGWSPWEENLELGYAIQPVHQGRGLAKEAAAASIKWALRYHSEKDLIGFALMNNSTSHHILEAVGMRRTGERMLHGTPHALFRYG